MKTPKERADDLMRVWSYESEDRAHKVFVQAITDAENATKAAIINAGWNLPDETGFDCAGETVEAAVRACST